MGRRGFTITEVSLVFLLLAIFAALAWTTLKPNQEAAGLEAARLRLAAVVTEFGEMQRNMFVSQSYTWPQDTFARVRVGGASTRDGNREQQGESTDLNTISIAPVGYWNGDVLAVVRYNDRKDTQASCLMVLFSNVSEFTSPVRWGELREVPPEACRAGNPDIDPDSISGTMAEPSLLSL